MDGQHFLLPSSFIFLDRPPPTGDSRLKTNSVNREEKPEKYRLLPGLETIF